MSWLPATLLLALIIAVLVGGWLLWQRFEFNRAYEAHTAGQHQEAIQRADRLIAFGWPKERARELRALALIKLSPDDAAQGLAFDDQSAMPVSVGMEYLRNSQQRRSYERVDEVYDALGPTQGGEPDFLMLQAEIEFARNHPARAMEALDRLLTIDPKHNEALLLKGTYLLSQPSPLSAVQAKSILRRAAQGNSQTAFHALLLLGSRFEIPLFENDRQWLLSTLEKHPQSTPMSQLIIATQQILLEPAKRDALIQAAVQANGAEAPQLTANWLLSIGAYEPLIAFLNSPAAGGIQSDQRWVAQMQALLQQGSLTEAIQLVEQDETALDALRRATLLAHIEANQAAGTEPNDNWRLAYAMASEQQAFAELLSLANLAQQKGWHSIAKDAYQTAIDVAPTDADKSRALTNLFIAQVSEGQTGEGLQTLRQYLAINPDSHTMINNACYLEALLGAPSPESMSTMHDLVAQMPNSIYPSTYAFMLWKSGDYEAAARELKGLNRRYLAVPSCRLSAALVALEQNDATTAKEMLQQVDAKRLLPEELTLYQDAVQKTSG
ncbi:tetratricopeptide repeat protein [Cerasicoccus fimbriatus]|uniref:tetratricopeptide repeat protein n=1 Tax=Cerasicoccus fimbriatus TaxID=3014554 RepID=UPI0022B52B30|nr:tetratricopeptide repeat protein [Cerasicoccus sp. TK19100]